MSIDWLKDIGVAFAGHAMQARMSARGTACVYDTRPLLNPGPGPADLPTPKANVWSDRGNFAATAERWLRQLLSLPFHAKATDFKIAKHAAPGASPSAATDRAVTRASTV